MKITWKTAAKAAGVLLVAVAGFGAGFYAGLMANIRGTEEEAIQRWETSSALQLSTKQLLLVRLPDRYGAIQLLERGENYAKVRWWLQRERAAQFDPAAVESGTLSLTETYVPGTATDHSLGLSDPTTSTIRLGEAAVRWSSPNWFYYGREYGLRLADQSDIAEVTLPESFRWTYIR